MDVEVELTVFAVTYELINKQSMPINIHKKINICNEYDLRKNIIDPNKFSPPNGWNNRLFIRLDKKNTP